MVCPNCKYENNNNIKYCSNCGKKIKNSSSITNYLLVTAILVYDELILLGMIFPFIDSFISKSFIILIFAFIFPPLLILFIPLLLLYIVNIITIIVLNHHNVSMNSIQKFSLISLLILIIVSIFI